MWTFKACVLASALAHVCLASSLACAFYSEVRARDTEVQVERENREVLGIRLDDQAELDGQADAEVDPRPADEVK